MTQRRTLGEILVGLGRITESDVTKALEYQRHSGGYFGEALVACSLVTEDEIEWGLASQFDLPYVFPRAEEIDYEVASMVSPEWALANLTLPIMRTADGLTVVVESPIKTKAVEELRARTHLDVQLALASPSNIRELVREVHARAAAADEDEARRPPLGVSEALDFVLAAGAPRFGVSVRGARAWTWWEDAGTIRRRGLSGDWLGDLTRAMDPDLRATIHGHARRDWSAELRRGGPVLPVDVHYLADESGQEFVFRPRPQPVRETVSYPPPPEGIVSEVRLLARSGAARFVVTTRPPELGHEMLPHLPSLLLDPSWRSIHVHARERPAAAEAFSHRLREDPETWPDELGSLRVFRFDVATLDLPGGARGWMGSALDLASVAFLRWTDEADPPLARDSGIRWHLHVARRKDLGLDWSLEPLPT